MTSSRKEESQVYHRMVFSRQNRSIVFGAEALSVMERFKQKKRRDLEAGGVLLGRYIEGTFDKAVDEVTGPLSGDERSRFGFYRDAVAHQNYLNKRFYESKGTCHYLGEWHTHPQAIPVPSVIDLNDWRKRLVKDVIPSETVCYVIVGIDEIRVWEGNRLTKEIHPMPFVSKLNC